MSAAWVVQALVAAVLLSAAGLAAERVAAWLGWQVRFVWAAAMAATVGLPMLALWAPGLLPDLGILPDGPAVVARLDDAVVPLGGVVGRAGGSSAAGAGGGASLAGALLSAWTLVTFTLLAAVAWTYARFRRVRAAARRTVVDGLPVLVAERAGPAVMGLLRPEVVLPRWVLGLPEEERALIVAHEREHLAGRDSVLLFAGTVLVAAMPWCFSLWWQHGRLRQAIETDCDARVLSRGANRRSYGRILIRTASRSPGIPLLNPAWGESTSQLERRIMRMTAKPPRHPLLLSLPFAALALAILATACDVAGRGSGRADLATAPSQPEDAERAIVAGARAPIPKVGDVGIEGMSWPDHGGPSFKDGIPRPPTRHAKIDVFEGRPAWSAGLRDGDVLLSVNGVDTRTVMYPFPGRQPGQRYDVRVQRGSQMLDFVLEVGPYRI